MQQVEEKIDKFSRVLLVVALEAADLGAKGLLEVKRLYRRVIALVLLHSLNKICIRLGKLASHAQRIVFIDVLCVLATREVLTEFISCREAL